MLTHEVVKELFDYLPETGQLVHRTTIKGGKRKGDIAGSPHNAGYRQITVNGKKYLIHRLVWFWHFGTMPEQIDHHNRNRSDNRIENLRHCCYSQNHGNRGMQSNNTSGYKGVCFDKSRGKWIVSVAKKFVGYFDSKEIAATAYDKAACEHYLEFALTNEGLGNVSQ